MEATIPMKRPLIVILSLAGIVGSALGALHLQSAITLCQSLYSVDVVSLEVERDLEDNMTGFRRALRAALVSTDVPGKLSAMAKARTAGKEVQDALRHLRSLDPPEVLKLVDQFERSWNDYERVAGQIFRNTREADSAAAIRAERANSELSFDSALLDVRALQRGLEQHSKVDFAKVDQTLKYSVFGFIEFGVSVLIILGALAKANQDRRKVLVALQSTNDALAAAKEVEQQRAAILEMVGAHAPLARSLGAIVELPRKCGVWAGAGIWIANDRNIELQAVANVPDQLSEALRAYSLCPEGDIEAQLAELGRNAAALAGQAGLISLDVAVLHDGAGRIIGAIQVFAREDMADIIKPLARHLEHLASVAIENTLLYERLAFQAQHDTLTELPNRLLFHDRLDQAIRVARRNRKKLAVMWIDLDRYKQINDTLGHRVGDELLCEVGRRLRACLRATDSVARVGGDEFTVLITELTDASDLELVPSKIMHAIAQPMSLGGHEIAITASAGVSLFPEHADDPGALIRNADLAMYSAKQAGRNQYKIFRADLGAAAQRRLEIERELKTALERNEFTLVYQPLMKHGGKLDGVEALLRWTNAAMGEISPGECIPIAEEMGLIVSIGEWITRRACSDAAKWLQAGHELGRVAVNLSAIQCVDTNFGAMVERALKDFKLPPGKLEFEVTETALIRNLDKAIANIEYLRNLGVRFAIDDFGTGYSSLSQLRTLPIDCVKIDRSFIKDLEYEGNGCTTMVRGIIGLAHNLNLEVVAEGVETEEQFAVLHSLGCDVNQGFYLHRTMSSEAVEGLLQKGPRAIAEALQLLAASPGALSAYPSPA